MNMQSHHRINLISDTVTQPCPAMLEAMFAAQVGDDVFSEDPTVNRLQDLAAGMFGMEAALFCPSGTMTNQIAMACHTQRLEEVICHEYSHVYQYETGGYAYNSGISVQLLPGDHGILELETVAAAIRPDYDWLPHSSLLVVENTSNKGGGSCYPWERLTALAELCKEKGLRYHLDGARLFNAIVETGQNTQDYGRIFDSISICLSKGLGAPVGSLLLGNATFIKMARRLRKAMGGGMRQAGYLAAAGIYALENNIGRLKDDHQRAKRLGQTLAGMPYVTQVRPVQTNILIFDLQEGLPTDRYLAYLLQNGINASAFGPQTVRLVTHLGITDRMVEEVEQVVRAFYPR